MYAGRFPTSYKAPSPYRASVFALYQLSLVAGIALLPLALAAEQVGVHVPIGRVVDRLGDAYDRAGPA
jgi:hypothetical protein